MLVGCLLENVHLKNREVNGRITLRRVLQRHVVREVDEAGSGQRPVGATELAEAAKTTPVKMNFLPMFTYSDSKTSKLLLLNVSQCRLCVKTGSQ
jgi:hypothetical protein